MSRSVLLLAVPHELQGPQFRGFVEDQSYTILVKRFTRGVDIVFEEAGGYGPSIAEEVAKSILDPGHYWDIDPPRNERHKFGIAETQDGCPIDPCNSTDTYSCVYIDEHRKREELWLQRIQEQHFEKGFLICGIAHSLSFGFRLLNAGVSVDVFHYLPYNKLCTKPHA